MFGFIGMPGHIELMIVAFIILLLFGNRLPSLMRSMGRSVVEFKQGLQGAEDEFDDADGSAKDSKIEGKPTEKVEKTVSEK